MHEALKPHNRAATRLSIHFEAWILQLVFGGLLPMPAHRLVPAFVCALARARASHFAAFLGKLGCLGPL